MLFLWGSLWFQLNNFSLETITFFSKNSVRLREDPIIVPWTVWLHILVLNERLTAFHQYESTWVLFRTTLGGHTFVGDTGNVKKYSKWVKTSYSKTTFCTVNTPPFIFMDPFILTDKKSTEAHTQFSVNMHVPVWKQDSESHSPALVGGECYLGALLHCNSISFHFSCGVLIYISVILV